MFTNQMHLFTGDHVELIHVTAINRACCGEDVYKFKTYLLTYLLTVCGVLRVGRYQDV